MDAGLGKQLGDVVSKKGGSAAEDYYRYMLLKAKVDAGSADKKLLKFQSEKETIELSILTNLMDITESSPEFSQVVDITGSRDRYEQARILSEVVYDKARAEQILSWYTPNKESLTSHFKQRTDVALGVRVQAGKGFSDTLSASIRGAGVAPDFGALFAGRSTAAPATGGGGGGGGGNQPS
jgi:hypothetical protein